MRKYALLFAGCVNPQAWKKRYENDLGFMYNVLAQNNYEHIFVLYYDGRTIDYEGNSIRTLPGTKTYFQYVIDHLKKELTGMDQLFIFVSNHGTGADDTVVQTAYNLPFNEASINCFNREGIGVNEFERELNLIMGKKFIVLGQCHGGDFVNCNINESILMSANEAGKVSYACYDKEYDEFLYQFTSFLNGKYPDGTALNNVTFSSDKFIDAFNYAKNNNCYFIYPTRIYSDPSGNQFSMSENPQITVNNLNNVNQFSI